jgi:hypothetical protein
VATLDSALAIARERGARYDVAATLDVLVRLGTESEHGADERDSLLRRLGIVRLPALRLQPITTELAAV